MSRTNVFPYSSMQLWNVQSKAQTLFLVSVASSASGIETAGWGDGPASQAFAVQA